VEDVHFRLSTITWEELGWKSLAVNLSDIAAMGGQPRYALLTLGLNDSASVEDLQTYARGLASAGREFSTIIVGGDIVASPKALFFTVALYGLVPEDGMGPPMTRSSARPGDLVAVTGELGKSAAGLRLLSGTHSASAEALAALRQAHNRPRPRVKEGFALRASGVQTALDISDGLAGDLGHVARLSHVGIRLAAQELPVHPFVREAFGEEGFGLALFGGEEYELAFTAPPRVMSLACSALGRLGTGVTVVGEVLAEPAGKVLLTRPDGSEEAIERGGYDHLRV
jgi:thiamine-monophosphate kinase